MRPVLHHRRMSQCLLLVVMLSMIAGCGASARLRLQADERYQLAQSYLGSGSYLLAEQEVRKALTWVPDEPRYFELLALIYQAQDRLRFAEDVYRLALQQADVPPSVLVNYGTLLLQRGRLDEAVSMLRRALQDPSYKKPAIAYVSLGLVYLKKAELYQAVEQFRVALEYRPDLPEAHYNLGLVYARLQQREKAIRAFREAIRHRPSYVEAQASLGKVLQEAGRPEEARLAFERVMTMGKALLKAGRSDEARFAFEHVVTLAPDSDMAIDSRKQLKLLTP